MSADWNGKAEPFHIHPEGWGLIIVAVVAIAAIFFV